MEFEQTNTGNITSILLPSSCIGCVISTPGGSAKSRFEFIIKIVEDAVLNCPKDEKLAIVSLGSNGLLVEYLIGRGVIQNGFQNVSFYLIDPAYRFSTDGSERSPREIHKYSHVICQKFSDQLNEIYEQCYKKPMPDGSVKPLSKAQNLENHYPSKANVILLECMPPNHLIKSGLPSLGIHNLSSEKLFSGSHFASPQHANSIAFAPKDLAEMYINPFHYSMPFMPFTNPKTSLNSCVEWGCKVFMDGSFFVSFFGGNDYQDYANLPNDNTFEEIQKNMTVLLQRKIEVIKNGDLDKKLSQKELSGALLEVVNKISSLQPEWKIFYHRDYHVDRVELISFLSKNASCHYRKVFSLSSDSETDHKITENHIT